jgi:hypothetical protein
MVLLPHFELRKNVENQVQGGPRCEAPAEPAGNTACMRMLMKPHGHSLASLDFHPALLRALAGCINVTAQPFRAAQSMPR